MEDCTILTPVYFSSISKKIFDIAKEQSPVHVTPKLAVPVLEIMYAANETTRKLPATWPTPEVCYSVLLILVSFLPTLGSPTDTATMFSFYRVGC